jgi:hypothetical protein
MLKTFVESFVQPVLRQLVMLEQHYETDMVILALAGEKAKIYQKYGVNSVTDAILDKELTVTVNVGMGATDPQQKMQRFVFAIDNYAKITMKQAPPGVDLKEVFKEFMALSGYQDGDRFLIEGQDPALAKAMQENAQLKQMLMKLNIEKHNKSEANQVKLKLGHETNLVKLVTKDKEHESKARLELFKHIAGQEMAGEERGNQVEDRDVSREHAVEDRDAGFKQEQKLAKEKPNAA